MSIDMDIINERSTSSTQLNQTIPNSAQFRLAYTIDQGKIIRYSGSTLNTYFLLSPLTEVVGPIINLISGTHNFCKRREYAFNILLEYLIITLDQDLSSIKPDWST